MSTLAYSSVAVIILELLTALAQRRGLFPLMAAFLWYLTATDASGFVVGRMHVPQNMAYTWYFEAVTAGQALGMLAVTYEAAWASAIRLGLAAIGTAAFALATSHPLAWHLEVWFAALSWTGCFCGLWLLLSTLVDDLAKKGRPFAIPDAQVIENTIVDTRRRHSTILACYMALHAVLYSGARFSIHSVGLALNIGVGCCMAGWLTTAADRADS